MSAPTTPDFTQDAARAHGSSVQRLVGHSEPTTHEKESLNELHLFAGIGGGILGGLLLGHKPCCAVEIEPYARKVLLQRQRDGLLPAFPIWDDVRTFDGRPWRGIADVVCGGFPCQDISSAGRGAGLEGERSGLWTEMRRIIGEVEPPIAFVENSPMLTLRGLGVVVGELAEMGYDAAWGVLGACDAGAPHERERIWILAYSNKMHRWKERTLAECDEGRQTPDDARQGACDSRRRYWSPEPAVGRVANGLANGMDRYAALGNGQVPAVVCLAWRTLAAQLRMPNT